MTSQPAASPSEGERKTVTALFADIKGSMELMEDLDPEEARAIVDPALKLMMDAAHRYEGYIVQSTGDGIFALFGAPVAHEDHPQRALYAALRMQDEMRRYGDRMRQQGQTPIQVRVGVNTGEVVVRSIKTGQGQVEYTPIGHSTSLAARLQALATPGSVVVSEDTRKLVEGYFQLKPLGPTRIKGVSEPVSVYEVSGLGPLRTRLQRSAGRGLTKFVGRHPEMEALRHAAELAKQGHGQIVAAIAEAGVGKSRLFFEFKAVSQSGWMVLETFSVSHGKASAYLPVIDLLRNYFKLTPRDDERARREKVNGKILTLDRSLEDTIAHIFALLGIVEGDDPLAQMDAQIRKRRTLDALKRLLLRESLNQPLILIFEDLHWIDGETQTLLNLLADSIGTAKILLLVNYRPEYSHSWGSKTYYTQLRLDPLGTESAQEMLDGLLGAGSDLAALKRLIIERTEGNPFFIEETVQVLLDDGALVRDGTVKLTRPLGELKIPPTVQAILTSRIDHLPPEEKDLLQTLAVIGKAFPLGLVRRVAPQSDDQLDQMLANLQLAEFIYEQPAAGDIEYTFKHALTQEVAYNSILAERRKALHERTAQSVESLFADRLDDRLAEIAHHYGRSANTPKALEYLERAGRQAAERSAYTEAQAYLTNGLRLLAALPDDAARARLELALQASLAQVLMVMAGSASSPEIEQISLRLRDLAEMLGDDSQLFLALFGLRIGYLVKGELMTAHEADLKLVALAERRQRPEEMRAAYFAAGHTLLVIGDFRGSVAYCERAINLGDPTDQLAFSTADVRVMGLCVMAQSLCCLGYADRARRLSLQAQAKAREDSRPYNVVLSMAFDCELQHLLRDGPAALRQADAAIAYSIEKGVVSQLMRMAGVRAWALTESGQLDDGIAMEHQAIAMAEAAGVGILLAEQCALAEAYAKAGKPEEGLETVRTGTRLLQRTRERMWEAELHRLRGELELLHDPGSLVAAQAAFRQAIEVARSQSAKWWELRATVSLARLLAKQRKRDEARAMLAEIYNWFTEGFDTADLKDAKALLDELSG